MPAKRKIIRQDNDDKKKSKKKSMKTAVNSTDKAAPKKTKKVPVKKQKSTRGRPSKQKTLEQAKISGKTKVKLDDWKKQNVCCGSVSIGPQNQVLIEPKEIKKHEGKCMMEAVTDIVREKKSPIEQKDKKIRDSKEQKRPSKTWPWKQE